MLKTLENKKTETFLFVLIFFALLGFLNIHQYFFLKPQGIHFIRQTDSLSFINYYIKTGVHFFDIGNLNIYNMTGKTACEFPIFYYLAALLSVVGVQGYIAMKVFYLIIFFFTVFSIFKFLRKIFSFINTLGLTFLLFSSTVVLIYMMNYIPNFPALCFSLCGLIKFLEYKENPRYSLIYQALAFFLIAGLLKVTFAIYAIACLCSLALDYFKNKKWNFKILSAFGALFLILLCWNLFVLHYNKTNDAFYYLTSAAPFWGISSSERAEVFSNVYYVMSNIYYFQSTIHVFFIVVFVSLFFFNYFNKALTQLVVISLLGCVCYFFLFFQQFKYHDYYFMEYIPFLFLAFVNGYHAIVTKINSWKKISVVMSLALLILTFLSLNYADLNLYRRYHESSVPEEVKASLVLDGMESKLDSVKIFDDKKFLVVTDYSVNGALYFINRFGCTIQDTSVLNPENVFYTRTDYLIITDNASVPPIKQKLNLDEAILKYNGASVFKNKFIQ